MRPHRRTRRLARWFVAFPLAAALLACGSGERTWEGRTAREWTHSLATGDVKADARAWDALTAFAAERPDEVLGALAEALETRVDASQSSFGLVPDEAAIAREGLPRADSQNVVAQDIQVLQTRAQALGLPRAPWKVDKGGRILVTLPGSRSRDEVERIQAALCVRGTLEIRPVVGDPAAATAAGAPPVKPFDLGTPFGPWREQEVARWRQSEMAATPYRPSDARYRVVPQSPSPGSDLAAEPLIVEMPAAGTEGLDERAFSAIEAKRDLLGTPFLLAQVRRERWADVAASLKENAGRAVAVVVDGRVRATLAAPLLSLQGTVALPLWRAKDDAAFSAASDLATVLMRGGRLPIPMVPVPLGNSFADVPQPDVPAARFLVSLGEKAVPTLERVEKEEKTPWAKESATWALGKIRDAKAPR